MNTKTMNKLITDLKRTVNNKDIKIQIVRSKQHDHIMLDIDNSEDVFYFETTDAGFGELCKKVLEIVK